MNDFDWSGVTVLLTGSRGFMGQWLVQALCEQGANVIGVSRSNRSQENTTIAELDRDRLSQIEGDVTDYDFLLTLFREKPIDIVFHFAGQTQVTIAEQYPLETFEANTRGVWNLLEAMRVTGSGAKVIYASSYAVKGEAERAFSTPLSPYVTSKLCAEMICRTYSKTYDLPLCITRSSNVYGGGDLNYHRLIPGTIRTVLEGRQPVLRSDGKAQRDFLYVEDAVRAYLLLAQQMLENAPLDDLYHFASDKLVTVLDIVKAILSSTGRQDLSPVVLGSASSEPVVEGVSSKAQLLPGWKPIFSLEQGLEKTIDWYKACGKPSLQRNEK